MHSRTISSLAAACAVLAFMSGHAGAAESGRKQCTTNPCTYTTAKGGTFTVSKSGNVVTIDGTKANGAVVHTVITKPAKT